MSLAERVSAMEDFESDGRTLSPEGKYRRLSFNPMGSWDPPAAIEAIPVGAFEVSKTKRMRKCCVLSYNWEQRLMVVVAPP